MRRAVITKTLRILPDSAATGIGLEAGALIADEDIPVYCRAGTKGHYDPEDSFFKSDDGAEFYPPEHAIKYL